MWSNQPRQLTAPRAAAERPIRSTWGSASRACTSAVARRVGEEAVAVEVVLRVRLAAAARREGSSAELHLIADDDDLPAVDDRRHSPCALPASLPLCPFADTAPRHLPACLAPQPDGPAPEEIPHDTG